MKYNTEEKRLALPDYGRNIQNMVDHCLTIADREERTRCANTIISIMGNMFPHLRDVNHFKHILWDHLAIMSDFQLDIDYPYEVIKKEELFIRPQCLPYPKHDIRYRHYGKTIELMIDEASKMEEGPMRDRLIQLLATHMKLDYLVWNKDSVDDEKILKDLAELSGWKLSVTPDQVKLAEGRELMRICNGNAAKNLSQTNKTNNGKKAQGGSQKNQPNAMKKNPSNNPNKKQAKKQ